MKLLHVENKKLNQEDVLEKFLKSFIQNVNLFIL